MLRWLCFALILNSASLLAGEILTTSDFSVIEEIAEELDSNSLVLFDVDATLIVPKEAILKPEGKELFKQLTKGYKDRDLFRDIRMQALHSLVDNRSLPFIQKLKERKIPALAFTAAPAKIRGVEQPADWRVNELKRYGFDFSKTFSNCNFLELPKNASEQHIPMFKSGVLFSSFHPKGDILVIFLQMMDLHPKKVLFVDDEIEHVRSVVTSLEEHGIECIGIHYTAANNSSFELNAEQARFQVDYFAKHNVWLSDLDSQKLLQSP